MIRFLAILMLAFTLTASRVSAQTPYTLKEAADVHQSPSTSSPVIGRAVRGRQIELTRDVGDWAEIVWTSAPNHTAFIRVRMSRVPLTAFRDLPALPTSAALAPRPMVSAAAGSDRAAGTTTSAPESQRSDGSPGSTRPQSSARQAAAAVDIQGYQLPAHTVGFGIRMDPRFHDFGGSARLWPHRRLGAQLEVVHETITSDVSPGHLTTWQFSPAALAALPDVVQSSIWIKPYAGAGVDLLRSASGGMTPGTTANDTSFGTRILGGAELTFAGAPQVAVSVDAGYRWLESSFSAFELRGPRASIAVHWYIR